MPLLPSVAELNTQLLFLILKSGIKPSEGSSQGGSQQMDPLKNKLMNDSIKLAHGFFWSWVYDKKCVVGSDPFRTVTS